MNDIYFILIGFSIFVLFYLIESFTGVKPHRKKENLKKVTLDTSSKIDIDTKVENVKTESYDNTLSKVEKTLENPIDKELNRKNKRKNIVNYELLERKITRGITIHKRKSILSCVRIIWDSSKVEKFQLNTLKQDINQKREKMDFYDNCPYELDLEVDFHGLTLSKSRKAFDEIVDYCRNYYSSITVIHGFNRGTVLRDYFRSYYNLYVENKFYPNPGRTTFIVFDKERAEHRHRDLIIENQNKALTMLEEMRSRNDILEQEVMEYFEAKTKYEPLIYQINRDISKAGLYFDLNESKFVRKSVDFKQMRFEDLYIDNYDIEDYLQSAQDYIDIMKKMRKEYPIVFESKYFITYDNGNSRRTIDWQTINNSQGKVYIENDKLVVEN